MPWGITLKDYGLSIDSREVRRRRRNRRQLHARTLKAGTLLSDLRARRGMKMQRQENKEQQDRRAEDTFDSF
jgi:hypothetical protein